MLRPLKRDVTRSADYCSLYMTSSGSAATTTNLAVRQSRPEGGGPENEEAEFGFATVGFACREPLLS